MKMDGFGAAQVGQCFAVLALHLHLNLGLHNMSQLGEHNAILSELCNSPHTV